MDGYYQQGSECVSSCAGGTYNSTLGDGRKVCLTCELPCATCTGPLNCTSCISSYYMDTLKSECVLPSHCPNRTYPEPSSRTCASCDSSCLLCIGPRAKDCLTCDFANGYGKSGDECHLVVCPEGTYVKKNYTAQKLDCEACDPSCATCDDGSIACIDCTLGRVSSPSGTAK